MRYCIIINNKIKEEYDSETEALPRLKLKNSKLVKIPDICIGLKIYSNQNDEIKYIGEIVDESENLWFTRKSEKQDILDPWMNGNFEQKYIDGIFVVEE